MSLVEPGGLPIRAVSVGGLETCIEVPSWKLCFDIGRCPPTAVRLPRVLFTHAHCDHMGGVIHHCATRALYRMSPPHYHLPAANHEAFLDLLSAWRRLDGAELPCEVHPVKPGDRFRVGHRRVAAVFRAVHRVPCVGYALIEERTRLKAELADLPREELVRRRKAGESVEEVTEQVELAFCGDTTIEVVEREPLVRQARVLVLEVTFLDGRVSVAKARRQGHVHLDEVVERAHLFQNEALLFTHFSARYGPRDILRLLDRRLPADLRERVTPLLPSSGARRNG